MQPFVAGKMFAMLKSQREFSSVTEHNAANIIVFFNPESLKAKNAIRILN